MEMEWCPRRLDVQPLYCVPFGTGVTMVFKYLPALEIICVKGEPVEALLEIVPGDCGESSPNPANEYQLDEWCVDNTHLF